MRTILGKKPIKRQSKNRIFKSKDDKKFNRELNLQLIDSHNQLVIEKNALMFTYNVSEAMLPSIVSDYKRAEDERKSWLK